MSVAESPRIIGPAYSCRGDSARFTASNHLAGGGRRRDIRSPAANRSPFRYRSRWAGAASGALCRPRTMTAYRWGGTAMRPGRGRHPEPASRTISSFNSDRSMGLIQCPRCGCVLLGHRPRKPDEAASLLAVLGRFRHPRAAERILANGSFLVRTVAARSEGVRPVFGSDAPPSLPLCSGSSARLTGYRW